jgi:hypothetical protein
METRDVELARFARKADGYKAALQAAPTARTLELAVTVAMIRGLFTQRGWDQETTPIVDLMAGTGVVSDYLRAAGFGAVHSIEACHEMLPASDRARVNLNEIRTLADAQPIVRRIKPAVIVSLAGFHHLIEYDGKTVNRFRSVLSQAKVIEDFLPLLAEHGVFLIVDIVEPTAAGNGLQEMEFWDGSVFRAATVLPDVVKTSLMQTHSMAEYERIVETVFPDSNENPTLRWFREVVDPGTVLGHDDIALSDELLGILRMHHSLLWARFRCPWIFENEDQLKFFLARKFGFMVDRKTAELDFNDLVQKAKTYSGIHGLDNGRLAFGWNLAALAIPRGQEGSSSRAYLKEANILAICIALLLAVRLTTRLFFPTLLTSIESHFDKLIFVFVGLSVGVFLHWFLQRKS